MLLKRLDPCATWLNLIRYFKLTDVSVKLSLIALFLERDLDMLCGNDER